MRRTWEWEAEGCEPRAAEDPGKKRARRERKPEGWVLAARSESLRLLAEAGAGQEAGASAGRLGEVPGGPRRPRPPLLPAPPHSSPSLSPNPKVLQVRGAAPCSLLQPAVQGTPLTPPKAPPQLLGSGAPHSRDRLRARARGLPSLKSPGESPRGRREKPAPPQPRPRPAARLPRGPPLPAPRPAAGSGSLPAPPAPLLPPRPCPDSRLPPPPEPSHPNTEK